LIPGNDTWMALNPVGAHPTKLLLVYLQPVLQIADGIGFTGFFIFSPSQYSWKTQGDAGFVPRAFGYTLEGNFKNMVRCYTSYRSEFFYGISFDPVVYCKNFFIC